MFAMEILAEGSLLSALTAVYWITLIVGGGLLLFSAFGGDASDSDVDVSADVDADFEVDFDADGDFDVDADHFAGAEAGALSLSTWFSIRFLVFFMAAFGVVGVVLTHLSSAGHGTTLAIALVGGLVVGQSVHQIFRAIRRTSGNSVPRPSDYVKKLARVTILIQHPNKGEVAIQVRNARRFVPAVAEGAVKQFDVGDEVVVVGYRAGVARVVSREEFERQFQAERGETS